LTLPRRRRDRPIASVELRISFRPDKKSMEAMKSLIPGSALKSGAYVVKVRGEQPAEVADRAREVLEKVRSLTAASKGFK